MEELCCIGIEGQALDLFSNHLGNGYQATSVNKSVSNEYYIIPKKAVLTLDNPSNAL